MSQAKRAAADSLEHVFAEPWATQANNDLDIIRLVAETFGKPIS